MIDLLILILISEYMSLITVVAQLLYSPLPGYIYMTSWLQQNPLSLSPCSLLSSLHTIPAICVPCFTLVTNNSVVTNLVTNLVTNFTSLLPSTWLRGRPPRLLLALCARERVDLYLSSCLHKLPFTVNTSVLVRYLSSFSGISL